MKFTKKMMVLLVGLTLLFSTPVYARTTSQEDVLAKSYHATYNDYYIGGAKVITGVHTTHTWGYKYYDTNSTGNRHMLLEVVYC